MLKLAALSSALLLSTAPAQTALRPADWQADLRFLQDTVHEDYPFLFDKITAARFDEMVEELHAAIPGLEPHEIVAGLARIVSSFRYGHTQLSWTGSPVEVRSVPLNLYSFRDGIWVEGAHRDCAPALGARIAEVEGLPVDEALAAVRPLVPAENDQYFRAHGLRFLLIPEALHAQGVTSELKDTVTLTLTRGGETFEETFGTVPATRFPRPYGFVRPGDGWSSVREGAPEPLYLRNLDRIYELEHLPEHKTLYVRHSQIQDDPDEPIPQFYARVFEFIEANDVERLVLDLRLNGGGNNYKNKPIVTGILRCSQIDQPGRLFVIIGRRTFSACQNLVNELDNYTNAIFVGEPTSENVNFFGDNRRVVLPHSRTPVFLSFAWWQDKPPWENADWLAPDFAVEPSFADHRAGRDPVLQAILELASEDFIADPAGHLRGLASADTLDDLRAEAQRIAHDPWQANFDLEDALNRLGYELLGTFEVDVAESVLRLNTELFPESANTWDSLGEVCWRAGREPEAIEHYRHAIELDPDGPIGDNARTMLERIAAGS